MALGRVASPTSALAACSPPPPERWERAPGAVCSTFLSVRPGFACPDYGPWCVRGLSRHEIKRTAAARGVRPFRAPRMLFTWFLFSNPIHMGRGRGLRGAAALTFSIHLPSCVVWARSSSTLPAHQAASWGRGGVQVGCASISRATVSRGTGGCTTGTPRALPVQRGGRGQIPVPRGALSGVPRSGSSGTFRLLHTRTSARPNTKFCNRHPVTTSRVSL